MQQTITPDKQSVESCLSDRTYYIDFYQREYVWTKETVEILLRDIFYVFDISYEQHKDSQLTPEVLGKYNWYYLNVFITNTVDGKVFIVDGQQRLTTLTLIATKLYHLTSNENLKDALKSCIFGKDKWKGNVFRLDHEKRVAVMNCLLEEKPYTESFKNKTEETLVGRYADISKYIDDKKMDEQKIDTFISYFLERLVMVELSITKDDTPMIFEVINDRGEALKSFEILKGKLVGALSKTDTENYSQKWDTAVAKLHEIENDFFIDYIKAKFVFKRNSKIEASINQQYHRYIFESNEIADSLQFRKTDKNQLKNIKCFIDSDLRYYSKLYSKIKSNKDEYLKYCNGILQFSGQYQIILSACKVDDPEEDKKISIISKEYERLYTILRLNGAYDSNSFQEISYSLNEKIRDVAISDYRQVFDAIITDAIKERKQIAVVNSLLDYTSFLRMGYTTLEQRFLRFYLARIEQYICAEARQGAMKDSVEYIATKTGYKTGYHIEHILCHNETNLSYFKDEEDFESHRNLLGGLLLLKDRDNISSGNEEYEDKLKTYSSGLVWGHSLCQDFYHANKDMDDFNAQFQKEYGMQIHAIDKFDDKALEERNKLLYQLTKIIWEIN